MFAASDSPMPDTRDSSGTDARLTSTPTPLTQSSTTASSERDSLASEMSCWYCPTPIDFGSIFTSSASGSCRRRAIDTAPRSVTSRLGNSWASYAGAGVCGPRVDRRPRLADHRLHGRLCPGLLDVGDEFACQGLGLARGGAVA